jgi:shikimate dehydrogenase
MKLFTIFGNPVAHSKSPIIHNSVFSKFRKDYRFTRTLLENGLTLKEKFFQLNLSGASVTVPHKEIAFSLCDEVRGVASEIGAVNCLVEENGKLIGYNTDVYGFLDSISDFKDIKSVLIIGAGGTGKALTIGFLNKGWRVSIVNRSAERLESFKELPVKTYLAKDFFPYMQYDLIVNVTSAGLSDQSLPLEKDILMRLFSDAKYGVDVIYHETPFLKLAKESGLKTKDGSLMLVYQGVLANQLFTKGEIPKEDIENSMLKAFYSAT